jgi:hypothetical protein
MSQVEHSLKQRMRRVKALHDGATTPGERAAAASALERLMARLDEVRAADPVASFVRDHVTRLGIDRAPEPPSVPLPSTLEVARVLTLWEQGDWSTAEVATWASALVGAVDLPSHPDAHGAVRAEVLLQLAMVHRVPLRPHHVPAIRRFLRTRAWEGWFVLLADVAAGDRIPQAV